MTRRMPRGEDGAYAILYGLLLLVVLGTAALVVDLAAMREDRRSSRLASDAAVVAGARWLDPTGDANPYQACVETLSYVATNLDLDPFPATSCDPFTGLTCTAVETTAEATSDEVTVSITWPVLQGSTMLTNPNVTGDKDISAQTVDPDVDGTADDACARLGVSVTQVHEPLLAAVFGVGDTPTTVTSVARAMAVPGNDEAIAALNVLNETRCQAILTSGQGFVHINAVDDRPGIISVESSGRDHQNACPASRPWVIDGADNASGGDIRADGPDGEGLGVIYSYALNAAPKGNPTQAFDPSLVPPGNTLLRPKPTLLSVRVGDAPVRDIYDCTGDCDAYPESYVDTLRDALQTGALPDPYEHHEAPYDALPFAPITASGFGCNIGPGARVLVPAGNWIVNCPTLTVRGTLVFAGGTVVTTGGISVQGCLAVNVPVSGSSPNCPTVSGEDTVPSPGKGAILYVRNGSFAKGANGSLLMPRTFVYMNSGAVAFTGGPSGTLFWTNPRQTDNACDDTEIASERECNASRFSKLSLWNETTNTQALGGQSSLVVRGVVFVPKATFRYTGETTQNQTNAQFWADRLEVGGQSGLTMAPDPTDAVASPTLGVVLIR